MDESSYQDVGEPLNYCGCRHSDPNFRQWADSYGSRCTTTTAATSAYSTNGSWESRRSSGARRLPSPPHAQHPSHRRASFTNRYSNDFDKGEQARVSRPDYQQPQHQHLHRPTPYHSMSSGCGGPTHTESDPDRRTSSDRSLSGSTVCSRSAPARRTPIPREPSVYRADSSCHSSSSLRTFEYRRRSTDDLRRRQSVAITGHQVLPPAHMARIVGEQRQLQPSSVPALERRVTNPTEGARNATADTPCLVDIVPGVQAPLRGTREIYQAVSNDFHSNVTCWGCSMELCCIADLSYIVCPECKVISSLEGCLFEGKEVRRWGLGLGFRYETLFQMQVDIMKERKTFK
jgi:hypothetical protein